jgi:hypothetical protein
MNKYLLMTGLLLIASTSAVARTNIFCHAKFGSESSLRFVPPEAEGEIAVTDGISGAKVTETKPRVSPSDFVCVMNADNNAAKCKQKMTFDSQTFMKPYCISDVFSLKKLCPDEVLAYSKILNSDFCKKR